MLVDKQRSFVYRPPSWRRWRNVKTTQAYHSRCTENYQVRPESLQTFQPLTHEARWKTMPSEIGFPTLTSGVFLNQKPRNKLAMNNKRLLIAAEFHFVHSNTTFAQFCSNLRKSIGWYCTRFAIRSNDGTVNATFAQHLLLGEKIMRSHGFEGHMQMCKCVGKYVSLNYICTLCKW